MTPYYEADGITIYHADCLSVLAGIDSVDHVITDPPYEAEAHTLQRRVKREGGVLSVEPLDFAPMDESTREAVSAHLARVAGRWILVFCQIEAAPIWRSSLESSGAVYKRTCIWVKPDGMPQLTGDRPGMGYEGLLAMHARGRSRWNGGGRTGVWVVPKRDGAGRNPHPTQKPEQLMSELITEFTDAGEVILDPFMGSGTTLVAAKRHGRRAIGIEQEERYCELAVDRLRQGALAFV